MKTGPKAFSIFSFLQSHSQSHCVNYSYVGLPSSFALHTHARAFTTRATSRTPNVTRAQVTTKTKASALSLGAPLCTNFIAPFAAGARADFSGHKIRPSSLNPEFSRSFKPKRGVVTMEDEQKPIYLYINSTGTTKSGEKLGYETESFAICDVMRYVKPPIFTLCVGNAWGEAALLLAAGAKGKSLCLSFINNHD